MLDEDGDEVGETEVYNKTVKQKKVVESYFDAASIININNHMRQGGLALETAWRTQSWASRVVATVLGIVETDAYHLYKKFHPGGTRLSHFDFTETVAKGLLLQNSVGIQATHARVETENAALPNNILPLSSLLMYNSALVLMLAGYAVYAGILAKIIAQIEQRTRLFLCVDYM